MTDWFVIFGLAFAVGGTVVGIWAFIKQLEADKRGKRTRDESDD